jgi:hypothetical protein
MSMRILWIRATLLLAAVWLVAGGIMMWARNIKPSSEAVSHYIDTHSVEGRSPTERRAIIDDLSTQINRLDFEERRETRMEQMPDRFFRSLNPEEQSYFLERTLPEGFKEMLIAFNRMTPEKRFKLIQRTLEDLRRDREQMGFQTSPSFNDSNVQKILLQGLQSFYSDASTETKMDFAPIIEELQKNMQSR